MSHKDRVPEKISSMGQHADERLALWQAITESFEKEGADGVEYELARRMASIRNKFKAVLAKLEDML